MRVLILLVVAFLFQWIWEFHINEKRIVNSIFKKFFTYSFFILIVLGGLLINVSNPTYANENGDGGAGGSMNASDPIKIKTITSEMVPGATCDCLVGGKTAGKPGVKCDSTKVSERKYECTTDSGMLGFQTVFAKIIRYVINIVLLLGVLAVVGLGIAWSFAGGDDVKMKSNLKSWAINIIIGLIILFMFRYILLFLAPWVYV